jgi:DNA-binding GntR family transcriptional regulator
VTDKKQTGADRAGGSVVTRVADELRQQIKSGRLMPGHRLAEAQLTAEFGVSRGPVREAISRLNAEGLVELAPHKMASVRQMTRTFVAELFTVRELLEGGAARLAAENLSDSGQRKRLKAELAAAKRWTKADSVAGYPEVNEAFHELVIEIADNAVMAELIAQLQTHAYRVLFVGLLAMENVRRSAAQHAEIAEAILAGEPAKAEQRMRRHIRSTAEQTLELQSPFFQ